MTQVGFAGFLAVFFVDLVDLVYLVDLVDLWIFFLVCIHNSFQWPRKRSKNTYSGGKLRIVYGWVRHVTHRYVGLRATH